MTHFFPWQAPPTIDGRVKQSPVTNDLWHLFKDNSLTPRVVHRPCLAPTGKPRASCKTRLIHGSQNDSMEKSSPLKNTLSHNAIYGPYYISVSPKSLPLSAAWFFTWYRVGVKRLPTWGGEEDGALWLHLNHNNAWKNPKIDLPSLTWTKMRGG